MTSLVIRNADWLLTMDAGRREIANGGIVIRDGVIEQVGPMEQLQVPEAIDRVLDLSGHIVLPGLINTHHHLYQNLTRAVPAAQDAALFDWLRCLYPLWAGLTGEALYVSALVGLAELVLSGCTTSSDHLYLYPNDCRLDDTVFAARAIGIRFHPTRGSMSLGARHGGLPPDALVEDDEAILRDTRRVIETYHDPRRYAMLRIGVAPCSPFSVSRDLMRAAAELARSYGVRLHTHLAENREDIAYSLERFGVRPGEYIEQLGWVGDDVWHAHCVHLDEREIDLFARTGTGIAHCPGSNMRLSSGVLPLRRLLDRAVAVGLGVDGSASNDAAHLLAEARQALLLQRVAHGAAALGARQALELATVGGARVLGRDDIGALAPQMAADIIAFDLNRLEFAGACEADAVAALVFCQPSQVSYSLINGKLVVDQGRLTGVELPPYLQQHRLLAKRLLARAG